MRIAAVGCGTYFLSTRYNLLPADGFYDYIENKRKSWPSTSSLDLFSKLEVNRLRFVIGALIWFFITAVIVAIIESIIRNAYRRSEKNKEEKPAGKIDHFFGYIFGILIFCILSILPASLFISMERLNIMTNGRDLIDRTLLKFPVNYAVKPLSYLVLPKDSVNEFWDSGIIAFFSKPEGVESWIDENSGSEN